MTPSSVSHPGIITPDDPTNDLSNHAGTISRSLLYDRAISVQYRTEAGPFPSVAAFHAWFTSLYLRPFDPTISVPDPYRQDLSDDSAIVFTHGDLHPSNIMLSPDSPHRVAAIIDWEQSGWFPEYWEDRKAHYTASYEGEWSEKYLPLIMEQYAGTWDAWDYYTTSMGC